MQTPSATPPAAAPAAPASTPPPAAPAAAPAAPAPDSGFKNKPFEGIEEMLRKVQSEPDDDSGNNGDQPPPEPKKVEGDDEAPPPQPEPKEGEPPKVESYDRKFQTAKELRAELNRIRAENERLAQERAKPVESPDLKVWQEKATKAEQQAQALEERIRFTDYTKSTEYAEKYHEPLKKAWSSAIQDLEDVTVTDAEGETRKASSDDLQKVIQSPTQIAAKLARDLFGDDMAPIVMQHRKEIQDRIRQGNEAIEQFKKDGATRQQQSMEQFKTHFERSNQEAAQKFPQFFAPDANDPEGNDYLDQGFKLADTAINMPANMPIEHRAALVAEVRNRAAGFGRAVARWQKAESRVKALEKELAAFKSSTPGNGTPPQGKSKSGVPSIQDDLKAAMSMR
jgi:hypothetical protein